MHCVMLGPQLSAQKTFEFCQPLPDLQCDVNAYSCLNLPLEEVNETAPLLARAPQAALTYIGNPL